MTMLPSRPPDALLEAISDTHNVKITRIIRVTRLMYKLGSANMEIIEFMQKLPQLSVAQADKLIALSRKHDAIREELSEACQESVDAEETLVQVYRDVINAVWVEEGE